jgi:hypothetical protein
MNENSEIDNFYFCEKSEDTSIRDEPQKVREGGSLKEREWLEAKSKKMEESKFALSNVAVKKTRKRSLSEDWQQPLKLRRIEFAS